MGLSYYSDLNIHISVDPLNMYTIATTTIPNYGNQIAEGISSINNVWENLKLGWVGTTATQAEEFNDRWQQAIVKLFGTEADPGSGALSKIAMGADFAAENYNVTELGLIKMFGDFTNQLNAAAANTGGSTGNGNRNIDQGPITENTTP